MTTARTGDGRALVIKAETGQRISAREILLLENAVLALALAEIDKQANDPINQDDVYRNAAVILRHLLLND